MAKFTKYNCMAKFTKYIHPKQTTTHRPVNTIENCDFDVEAWAPELESGCIKAFSL